MRSRSAGFGFAGRYLALIAAVFAIGPCPAADAPAVARLDRTKVAAQGRQSALLTVGAFGRYAITASSSQGVALQAVDRMAGAGPITGEAGKQDGRLDLFLDRGEQKIVTYAAERGSGYATLGAHAFHELNGRPPLLVEHRMERASLGDFEQRSYWIEITKKRTVALEAAGRHLADLRLWRDGTWLVDVTPKMAQSQARPEQPLAVARLTAELAPGLYLLTAYGGPSQAWSEASEAKPFLLRFGIPTLAPAMRQQFTMSEFGTDRYIVPAGPSHFRLELPSAEAASLQVGGYSPQDPFRSQGSSAGIDKKSLPPVAELDQASGGERLVTVSMAAGKTFVLQHFEASSIYRFDGSGSYWVSSIHAGNAEDSVGASAVLTRQVRYGKEEYLAEQAIEIGGGGVWHRRFNLLDTLTLFIKLPATGKLRVVGEGVNARYRIEPFLTSRSRDYQTPPWHPSGHVFELDRGLHVLTIEPESKGIVDLHLLASGEKPTQSLSPVSAAARFPALQLNSDSSYALYLNRQPGVASGAVVRPLPIDLHFALPVTQRPGELLTIPVAVPEGGILRALAEDGHAIAIAIDDGRSGAAIAVEPGQYRVRIAAADKPLAYSLGLDPTRLASATPLPALPDARLAGLPKFPVVTPEAPRFLDLKRRSAESYSVRVDKPGLYQFESTGLLHTSGKVRTRTNPALFDEAENGVGRNFQIQRYLREGDYQLTVATRGDTAGNLGVQLSRTDVVAGGELREGEVARAPLPVGRALAYEFRIARQGRYHLQTLGLGRSFDIRLEDAQGWPVFAPVQPGDLTQELAPGRYRLLILPQTADARVLTRLDRLAEPRRYKGHGPHRIGIESSIDHVWQEPAKGAPRQPDQWEFVLPAAAEVTIALNSEMEATLINAAETARTLASIDAKQPWRGTLGAGRYVVRARHSRQNNYVPYTLRVAATQLLPGQSRTLAAPAVIPVSVGVDGLVELHSFGASDVRARLMDRAGETIAQNDDRPGDWNFHIARRLAPGEYRLHVDPVGQKNAQTTVSMTVPGEVVEKPLPPGAAEIKGTQVHVYPLQLPADRNVLLVTAKSSDNVGLALEAETTQGWINLGTEVGKDPHLALPLPTDRYQAYRLRAWSADRRSQRLSLRVAAAAIPAASESQWLEGHLPLTRVDETRPELKLALVALSHPGAFRVKGDLARLAWSDSAARTAQSGSNTVIAAAGKFVLLVAESDGASPVAERLRLPAGEQEPLRLDLLAGQVGSIDLQPSAQGPSLVLVQARAAQPGVAFGDSRSSSATGVVAGEAAGVVLSGVAQAHVWNAANALAPIELNLRQVLLQKVAGRELAFGIADGALKARSALPLKLPGSALRVRLTLSALNAAVFVRHDRILSTHWAGDESLQETVATDADQLWLLNAGADDARYGIELVPGGGEAEAALKPGELLERNLGTAGRLRVPVEVPGAEAGEYHLRVRGDVQALWQEDGGRMESGNDIVVRASGVLWLQHTPGTVVAWLDEPRTQGIERVGRWLKSMQETAVKPPQSVALKGKQQVLSVNLDQPAMLHLRTGAPVVSQFLVPGRPVQTAAHLHGAHANLPAPAGASRLVLRAIGSDSLSGTATIMATPVIQLDDGRGPEILLASGGARLFSFELKRPATVGIGIRTSADVVNSVLYDEGGTVQSQGAVQMPSLLPGRYFLSVDMPADSAPVRVQPIVLGLREPDTRPPYEILHRYVEAKNGGEPLIYVPPLPAPPPGTEAMKEAAALDEGEEDSEGEVGGSNTNWVTGGEAE